ncbi:hypothetical protein LTR84_007135 [Exophiala bonariae]|uniref:Metallo-beta-lactamase domain-containing protein n=1 Tax=Exophiala bonariae TaxID=1690606 RepID=A0AAV9MYX0_9EURO|nr:hypothetical protein LTR84_007135 [Exophiala bonariae]
MIQNQDFPPGSATVSVFALPTGHLYLPDRWLFEDGSSDMLRDRQYSPDFSFLIKHPKGKLLFDLGLRKDLDKNPQVIQSDYKFIAPEVEQDAQELLDGGPEQSDSITAVILSHLHFDHTGDCTKFPNAELVVGPGSRAAVTPGWPEAADSPFDGSVLSHPHFRELDYEKDDWEPLGPFSRAIDYFGDGSFYLIDAPGHMDGHLGALARTDSDEWIFMGGDCCHHRSLLAGTRPMSVTVGPGIAPSFHRYPDMARNTIRRVREIEKQGSVLVALAHDARLDGLMPLYPHPLNNWKGSQWKQTLDQSLEKDYPMEYIVGK